MIIMKKEEKKIKEKNKIIIILVSFISKINIYKKINFNYY